MGGGASLARITRAVARSLLRWGGVIKNETLLLVAAALAAVACGQTPRDRVPAPPGPAAVRFLVDPRPQDPASAPAEAAVERYGDPFVVVVDGLAPGAPARLEARLDGMVSVSTFAAAADGTVDLARDAPLPGSAWQGVDPEGILWSMVPDVTPPPPTLDLTVEVRVIADGTEVARGALARRFINDGLTVEPVNSGRTVGALVIPPGDGPFPALLVFGGSEGGTSTGVFNAQYLGSLGYAALGVGYFGAPGLPAELVDVPLEILAEDLAFLAADPRVDAARIGVMGGSRGGELALLLGSLFPTVHAVVADVPSGVVWGGQSLSPASAWSLRGAPLAHVPSAGGQADVTVDADGTAHIGERHAFEVDLAGAGRAAVDAATIHVEDTNGPVLLLAAGADAVWPSCALAGIAFKRLQVSHAQRYPDALRCFAGAGHLMGTPGWSTVGTDEIYDPQINAYLVTGGTPAGMGRADRAADTAMRAFLEENL